MIALLAAVVFAVTPTKAVKPPTSKPDAGVAALSGSPLEQAGEVKEIELDDKRARAVYRIRTAISIPAVIEFPESFVAPPACGDCADATKPAQGTALFALQAEAGGNILMVKPRLYPGPQADGSSILASDFVTTITVRLQSLIITLQIELTEDKKLADTRVRFVLPGRASESRFVAESVAKAKAQLDADFATRIEKAAGEEFLRAFLQPHECRSSRERVRSDDIVLELQELCRFGRRIYVRFTLENRSRSLFVIGDVGVGAGDGKSFSATEASSLLSQQEVAFQQTASGVVSVEGDEQRSFELRLSEQGGRTRVVNLQGFSF